MSSPSSNNGDNDAWLMKIDLKREEPTRVNKDERIKKATEDQAPEDNLQLDHNLLTPTKIEAFKMIELSRIQNKYLTREKYFVEGAYHRTQGHYPQVGGPPTLDVRLSIINNSTFFTNKEELSIGYGLSPWQLPSLGECPGIISPSHSYLYRFS